MSSWSLRARRAAGMPELALVQDPDWIRPTWKTAAHFPGGHATGIVLPTTEAAVAAALAASPALLPIGAQSSLTGGGTPMGDVLLSTARMNAIESIGAGTARVQAGVTLAALDEALRLTGGYYPPAPRSRARSSGARWPPMPRALARSSTARLATGWRR